MGSISKGLALVFIALFLMPSVALQQPVLKAQVNNSQNSAPAIEWQKTYGSYDVLASSNLIQASDGGYAFMDSGYTYQNFLTPATVFKVDSKGNLQWSKTIAQFTGSTIIETNDKGYEISGWWYLPNSASAITPTLIKMGTHGNIQWIQNYTTLPELGVNYTTYYIGNQIGGSISTSDSGSIYWTDGNITKTDSNNNTQWVKTLTYDVIISNTSAPLLLTSVIETSDGAIAALGIAPAGYSTFPTQGIMYLVKLETFLPVPSSTALPTPLPTSTSIVPEFPTWIVLPLFAIIVLLSTVFVKKRIRKK